MNWAVPPTKTTSLVGCGCVTMTGPRRTREPATVSVLVPLPDVFMVVVWPVQYTERVMV